VRRERGRGGEEERRRGGEEATPSDNNKLLLRISVTSQHHNIQNITSVTF